MCCKNLLRPYAVSMIKLTIEEYFETDEPFMTAKIPSSMLDQICIFLSGTHWYKQASYKKNVHLLYVE